MGYRIKRLQDMGRGLRASRELAEVERWPRERLDRLQRERLDRSPVTRASTRRSGVSACRAGGWSCRAPHPDQGELMERFDELVTDPPPEARELLGHLDSVDDDALYLGVYRAMTTSGSSGRKASSSMTAPAGRASRRCSCAAATGSGVRPASRGCDWRSSAAAPPLT